MSQLLSSLISTLRMQYDAGEARAIARQLLEEEALGLSVSQIFTGTVEDLHSEQKELLDSWISQLMKGVPLQYVLGKAVFCGIELKVGPGVLIPRPETEDLVEWIVSDWHETNPLQIMDACTGSGCIARALSEQLPLARLEAIELSEEALSYARQNIFPRQENIFLSRGNVLEVPKEAHPHLHVLVSNPPYIAEEEASSMSVQVKEHEPEMALFVTNENSLLFYDALAKLGQLELLEGGALYVEINQRFGKEVCDLFESYGYRDVTLRNDRFGNPRMVKGVKE